MREAKLLTYLLGRYVDLECRGPYRMRGKETKISESNFCMKTILSRQKYLKRGSNKVINSLQEKL